MQKTAAIYTRISQDRTGAGLGVDRQEKDCRELAERMGFEVADVYSDNDTSAYSGKLRKGYEALLEDITDGKISAVFAWHTDRLHRRTTELERYIEVVKDVPTYTVKGGHLDLSNSSGRMSAKIVGAVAQQEVEHMIERAERKHRELLEAGLPSGGGRPFGYEPGGMKLRRSESDRIVDATDRILAGASLASLIREWNEEGVLSSRGKPWSYSSFTGVITRWRNAGIREHKKEPVGPAQWDAIVTEEKLRKVRALLQNPERRTNAGRTGRKHLLSGIMTCGKCGSHMRWGKTMTRETSKSPATPYELYQCTGGLGRCRLAVLKEIAEEEVTNWVATRLAFPTPDLLEATANDRAKLEALNAKRAELAADEKGLEEANLSRGQRIKFTSEIEADRQKLEAEAGRIIRRAHLADMFSDLTLGKSEGVSGFRMRLAAEDIALRFKEAPLEKRQAIVRALLTVQVLPAHKGVRPTRELARQRIDITPLDVRTGERLKRGRFAWEDEVPDFEG